MQKAHFQMNIQLFGQTVYLAGSRSIHKGELMIIATHQKPQNAVATYLRRWETESLFKALKSHGFYFSLLKISKKSKDLKTPSFDMA